MSKEKEKIVSKAIKYKEANETLQEAIKEHQKMNEELQLKIEEERKTSTGIIYQYLSSHYFTMLWSMCDYFQAFQ